MPDSGLLGSGAQCARLVARMKRFLFWKRGPADAAATSRRGPPAESRPDAGGQGPAGSGLLSGDASEDQRSIEILLDTIAAVTADVDLDRVLREIVDRSLLVTRAERAILLLGAESDELAVRLAVDRDGNRLDHDLPYSRSLVRRCLEEVEAVRSVVQSDREALELGQSVYDLKLRAVMCAPLVARNRKLGVIYVDSRVLREFGPRDLGLFSAISAQLAIGLENARLYADSLEKVRLQKDVEIARRIQQHLLPPVPHSHPGLDLALRYHAAESASGDTYDFVPLGGDRLAIMVGDVTGHGLGAALLTHAAQAALRSYLELVPDPGQVVARLNQRLVASVETGNFMSLLLVVVDPVRRCVQYVNAGHPELMHVTQDGVRQYGKTGMVLGVVGGQDYPESQPLPLLPGDVLFLFTDGVDEAQSPARTMFGEQRLRELLAGLHGQPAETVLAAVEAAIRDHAGGGGLEDDLTMIAACVR